MEEVSDFIAHPSASEADDLQRSSSATTTSSLLVRKKRNLVNPMNDSGWSADVVAAIPKLVHDKLIQSTITTTAGALNGQWSCLSYSNGIFQIWYNRTCDVGEKLEPSHEIVTLLFPEFATTDGTHDESKPLLALATDIGDNNSVCMWVLSRTSGLLMMKKIWRKDLQKQPTIGGLPSTNVGGPAAKTRLVDDSTLTGDQGGSLLDDGETFNSLTCQDGTVVIGTSKGKMFWVTYTAVPVALHLQRVEPSDGGSWNPFTIMFGSDRLTMSALSGSEGKPVHTFALSSNNMERSVRPQSNPQSDSQFLSLTTHAAIQWNVKQPIASSGHHSTFYPSVKGFLAKSFADMMNGDWSLQQILTATLTFDRKNVHCIVRASSSMSTTHAIESRLYWIVLDVSDQADEDQEEKQFIVKIRWMDRFVSADHVQVLGMTSSEKMVFVSISEETNGGGVIVMAMAPDEDQIVEHVLSREEVPHLLMPGMMERDVITYGCYVIASTGFCIRIQYKDPISQCKRARLVGEDGGSHTSSANQARIHVLTGHLREFFWKSYTNPEHEQTRLPPSLQNADPSDFEQVLLTVAVELQKQDKKSTTQLPASTTEQFHKSLVSLVQKAGLYKALSNACKWKMMSIGQEIAVYSSLAMQSNIVNSWHEGLSPHTIVDWMGGIQSSALGVDSLEEMWHAILANVTETMLMFREDVADARYYVSGSPPTEEMWSSQPAMLQVLFKQVEFWKEKQGTGGSVARQYAEPVVKATLLFFSEVFDSSSSSETEKKKLEQVRQMSISVLRNVVDADDQFAFDLCVQHNYFDGICNISVSNEKKVHGSNFSLDPLMSSITATDLLTGWTFARFVLQWHTDRNLLGHVINYGRYCPEDLKRLMEDEDKLRSYRWIPAGRQGFYGDGCRYLMEDSKSDKTLKGTERSLSMARLASMLVVNQNQKETEKIDASIRKGLELVNAQKFLTGVDTLAAGNEKIEKLGGDKLFEMTMAKLSDSPTPDEQFDCVVVALNIVNSIKSDDDDEGFGHDIVNSWLTRIWAELLLLEYSKWTEFMNEPHDMTFVRQKVFVETLFGKALELCRHDSSMSGVAYGGHLEIAVIGRVEDNPDIQKDLSRLLHAVASFPEDHVHAESLMVSKF